MLILSSMVNGWNRFWFSKADPLPLGVIRLFTGLVILYVHLIYSLDLISMVSPDGWLDRAATDYVRKESPFYGMPKNWTQMPTEPYAKGMPVWSVFFHIDDPTWIVVTHCAFLLAMVLFTIGFATRLMAVVCWVAVLSYIQRLPIFMYGMDSIMNVLMLYLMVGPSGAALSVDRLIQKWWAKKHGLPAPEVEPSVSANFALRLMQIQFCFIYLASGLSKLQGPAWWNGNALWGTLANYSFAPMNWPVYVEMLNFLCRHRFLWELIMTGGTYFTLVLEISFPYLVWRPKLRWLMVSCSILLHTGIGVIMGLSTFSMCMICLVLAFVPAEAHHNAVNTVQRKLRGMWIALAGKNAIPVIEEAPQPATAGV